jgi:glycosyltransferase involved in cell wall biosynthesis
MLRSADRTVTTPKRVCIVTPGQLGSNPRVVKEAETLAAKGYSVRVVATKVADFVEPRDQAIMASAKFAIDRVAFDNRIAWRAERLRQKTARWLWSHLKTPRLARLAQSPMTRRLTLSAASEPADLYIAHYVAALPAAALAAKRHGAVYAFDAEDFHPGDLPDLPENAFDNRLIQAIETEFLPGAAYVSAAAPGIADAYSAAYGIERPTVILNAFPRSEAPLAPTPSGNSCPGPSLYWFSQTIGPNRGLECAVAAIAKAATRPYLHLRGTPTTGYDQILLQLAASLGVADRLCLHSPADPAMMARLASEYDAGLVSETGETRNRQIALTNKQFVYLLAGIPILMSDVPGHVAFSREIGDVATIYRAGNPDSLAAAIDQLLGNRERLALLRTQAFELAQSRFNWDVEAPSILACVAAALKTTAQPALGQPAPGLGPVAGDHLSSRA